MMKRKLILAALALLMTGSAWATNSLTDQQYNILGTFTRVRMIVKDCPFKENTREFSLWAIEAHLTPEMMESDAAKLFILVVTARELDNKEKRGNPGCDGWWSMYGTSGHDHANLLLKP